jgi:hypothetical protein
LEAKKQMETTMKRSKPITTAFALSLVGGILIFIQGVVRLIQGRALEISGVEDEIRRRVFAGIAVHFVGAIAVVLGVMIIVGAILLYRLNKVAAGALIVLVFSLLSILTFGIIGLVGLVFGLIGSVLALTKK